MFKFFPVSAHTDHIMPGGTFVCIKGYKLNGIDFIPQALEYGARTIVIEKSQEVPSDMLMLIKSAQAQVVYVDDARAALADLSAQAAGYPAKKLRIIAVTGTKGKTTSAFLLRHMLKKAGYSVAMLSTVHNSIAKFTHKDTLTCRSGYALNNQIDTSQYGECHVNEEIFPSELTTAQPDYVHQFLKTCVDKGVEWVVLEVAAQAFSLERVRGIFFDAAIYTNFTPEHGEFYPTLKEYAQAKARILEHLKPDAPLIFNADNQAVAQSVGFYSSAIGVTKNDLTNRPYPESIMGVYNLWNIHMAALCLARVLPQYSAEHYQQLVMDFAGVPGRLEKYVLKNGACVYIDYAHSSAAVAAVLSALREKTDHLIVVNGCGGDRDKTKRPLMGCDSAAWGDLVFITSDNPRSEDPMAIITDMLAGIPPAHMYKVVVEVDREKAIRAACAQASPSSIIALLGKGPDEYVIIKGVKYPFSEKTIIANL